MIDKRIYDLDYIRELQARYKTDYYTRSTQKCR